MTVQCVHVSVMIIRQEIIIFCKIVLFLAANSALFINDNTIHYVIKGAGGKNVLFLFPGLYFA